MEDEEEDEERGVQLRIREDKQVLWRRSKRESCTDEAVQLALKYPGVTI